MADAGPYPGGAAFAFTVVDDTDDATVDKVGPLYALLRELGMRATKTVWPFEHRGPSPFYACQTLEDPEYLEFVRELQKQGFEISWHCASFESSERQRTLDGLEKLKQLFGVEPRVHANHALNRENLYWGSGRVDSLPLRWLAGTISGLPADHYQGHVEGSPYWWGDVCERSVVYGRNLTFSRINLATINPTMPYRDPKRPLVPLWFSASDAESVTEFNALTSSANQERLQREGGFSIVATHFGKGFVRDGRVNERTRANLEELAGRPGWFPTTGELLDWLAEQRKPGPLKRAEWTRMQIRWAFDLFVRKLSERRKRT